MGDDRNPAPTSHIALLVLGLLEEEPKYGYAIIKELDARSNSYFQMKEGSLYPVLHQLERDGLLRTQWRQQRGKPNRRYYAITPRGRRALSTGRDGFEAYVTAIRSVLEFSA
jgi:PadR family transcriptional regulator PadR